MKPLKINTGLVLEWCKGLFEKDVCILGIGESKKNRKLILKWPKNTGRMGGGGTFRTSTKLKFLNQKEQIFEKKINNFLVHFME